MFAGVYSKTLAAAKMAAIVLCLYWLQPAAVDAYYEKTCTPEDRLRPQGICGKHLTQLVSTICRSHYNKRSQGQHLLGFDDTSDDTAAAAADNTDVFLPKATALAYLKSKRSLYAYDASWDDMSGGGLSCECCIHQCSINELLEYCEQPQRKRLSSSAISSS